MPTSDRCRDSKASSRDTGFSTFRGLTSRLFSHVFSHIAAAVDPPEVVVDLRARFRRGFGGGLGGGGAGGFGGLKFNAVAEKEVVRVIKKEAIGMYEVAVLEAGSAKALSRWMEEHGYKYPKGMDKACDDYVEDGWCFVAVKTKVGQKQGIDPRPGQRKVTPKLPSGANFDGHVQGMGFRFKSKYLVVPMRLSTFNKGDLRNIVYLLTDSPRRIRYIPGEYVRRQISGKQLHRNLTGLLPLRIIGLQKDGLTQQFADNYKARRDPAPHNGAAADLFASDLHAIATETLSLPHEQREKELLVIGERLGLRGGEIDKLNTASLKTERKNNLSQVAQELKTMTLTVIDGDFPREVLAKKNLTFANYKMPNQRNTREAYDATKLGPGGKKEGVLMLGANVDKPDNPLSKILLGMSVLASSLVGLLFVRRWRKLATVAAMMLVCCFAVATAQAQDDAKKVSIRELLRDLSDAKKAAAAVDALKERGEEAVPQLKGEALEGTNLTRRGWAIITLAEIGGKDVDAFLKTLHEDGKQQMLIRTWAAAGRVSMTKSTAGLIQKASLIQQFPALGRPIGMRILEGLKDDDEAASPEGILSISINIPKLQQALAPAILALGSEKLTGVLVTANDQNVRRQAAAYLGTLAAQGDKTVAKEVVKVYAFDADAKDVPWKGGPLFLPGIGWGKEDARALVGGLIRWHLWCDMQGRSAEQQQIHNNIRSISLAGAAGYQPRGGSDTVSWLRAWGAALGKEELAAILKEQNADKIEKYAAALK